MAHMRAAHFRRLLQLRQKTLHVRVLEHCVLRLSNSKCLLIKMLFCCIFSQPKFHISCFIRQTTGRTQI